MPKPKTFALLAFLAGNSGRLITRQEILDTVWPGIAVNEEVVTTRIRELRQRLGDERKTPCFIQTVHGRGYRFVAPLISTPSVSSSKFHVPSSDTQDSGLGTLFWWAVKRSSHNFTTDWQRRWLVNVRSSLSPEKQVLGRRRCSTPSVIV
ncbi:MAG: transcriptional regulator [Candidatus Binatia bacterium]